MQLVYGPYQFPVNGVQVGSRIQNVMNAAGIPITRKVYMDVVGDLLVANDAPNNQTDLTLQTNLLVLALRTNYVDLLLKNDDGSLSATILTNAGSLSGVTITDGPHFPGRNATGEYAVRRAFTFTAMCEYTITPKLSGLMSFTESLEFYGGLPLYVMCRAVNTVPQRQKTYQFTEYCCIQSGQAVGLLAFPSVPGPKFPQALKEAPRIKRSGPERTGSNYRNYGVTWNYVFESVTPLAGAPTLWTN
jgi:hypothetical protein